MNKQKETTSLSHQYEKVMKKKSISVPNGWSLFKSGDLFDFSNGNAFYTDGYSNDGYRVIDLLNIALSGSLQLTEKDKFISNDVYDKYPKAHLYKNDLIIIMTDITPTLGLIGKTAIIDQSNKYALNQRVGCLRPKTEKISIPFMNYLFNSDAVRLQIVRNTLGTAQFYVNTPVLKNLDLPTPPYPEQQKIATILSSVDTVIEKTRAQIDKLKHLKTGMMQQLLTKGIGHTEFKDSPVGRIPKEWDVGTLDSFGVGIFDGDRGKEYPKENDFYPSEFCLFLSAKNVTKNGFLFNDMAFITQEKDELLRKGKLTRGDIVITTRGTIGNIAFYSPDVAFENIRINSGMAIIRNSDTSLNSEFLHLLMNSLIVTEQTELLAFGSAQPQLTISIIKNLIVPKPNLDEQKAITSAVSAVNKKLQLANKKLDLLTSTKKALMQDLLTGKVRVKLGC